MYKEQVSLKLTFMSLLWFCFCGQPISLFNSPWVNWIFLPIMDSNPSAHVFKGGLMPLLHETLLVFFVTDHYNMLSWRRKILHVIWTYFYECLFYTWGGLISHGALYIQSYVSLHLLWRGFWSFTHFMSLVNFFCGSFGISFMFMSSLQKSDVM